MRDKTTGLGSVHQVTVCEFTGVDNPLQSIPEDMRVIAIIESPFQFLKVSVQVLPAHLVEGADNGTLEQAPHAFYAVGVDLSDNPFLSGVAHSLMPCIVISNPHVGLQLIGVNRLSLILNCSMDEIMENVTLDIGDALDSDLSAVPLDGTGHPCLAFLATRSDIAFLSTDQGFVHFHDPKQGRSLKGIVSHGLTNAVAQIPGCLVCDSQGPVKLIGAHSLFGFAHEVNGREPFTQGQVGVVHNGSRGDGEMVVASLAVPLSAPLDRGHFCVAATGACNAIGPLQALQMLAAFFIITETIKQRENIHESNS